jgi:hypothetical protein
MRINKHISRRDFAKTIGAAAGVVLAGPAIAGGLPLYPFDIVLPLAA